MPPLVPPAFLAPSHTLRWLRGLAVAGAVLEFALGTPPTLGAAQTPVTSASDVRDTLPPQPGDLIRLKVWREPDLTGEFPVNESGVVVLPQIGALQVGSTPADMVESRVRDKLVSFLNHTSVDVAVLRRVQVVGAVQKPGLYHVDPTMTIADAIALAGGVSSDGRTDRVEIIRDGKRLAGTGRMLISQSAVQSGDQLFVPERSWVSRNMGTILAGTSAITALAYVLTR
jgi:polysaccharide export outer membrane protein